MNERQFEYSREFYFESFKSMCVFASEALKSLFLISGGADIAILAFVGHLIAIGKIAEAKSFAPSLMAFFTAALLASASFCFSYLAQFFYGQNSFVLEEKGVSAAGKGFHFVAICATVLAYGVCITGMWLAFMAFKCLL